MKIKETLIFRDCVCWNQQLFFFSENIKLPVMQSLQGNVSEILPYDSEEIVFDLEICVGSMVYALNVNGRNMIKYDLNTHNYNFIEIECNYNVDANFAYLNSNGKKVFIFTREQKELVIYDEVEDTIQRVSYPSTDSNCYITGCSIGDKYLIFPQNGKDVLEYDTLNNTWGIQCLDFDLINCVHAMAENDYIYILLASGKVLKWDYSSKEIDVIMDAEKIYAASNAALRICLTNDEIIILPFTGQDIIKINRMSNKTSVYKDYPQNFSYDSDRKNWSKYYGYCENDTEYYFACRTSEYILKVKKQNGEISWIRSEIDKTKLFQVYLERKDNFVYEREGTLELFIGLENKKSVIDTKKINNGCKIWKEIGQG